MNGERGGLPPGPRKPGPWQTVEWIYRPIPFMERCRRKYGPIFSLRLGPGGREVMIADPQIAKRVMAGDPKMFRAGDTNGLFRPVVGSHSILVLDGEEHLRHRRIILPTFSGSHAQQFADQVREIAEKRVASWNVGDQLNLQDEMEQISFESIMRVVFGTDRSASLGRLQELIPEMMDRCDSAFTLLPWFRHKLAGSTPYARLLRSVRELDAVLFEVISERRGDPLNQLRDDALSLLLQATDEEGVPLDDRVVRDELLTLIMAGYETTTNALAWAMERLLRSPAHLERLRAEIETGGETFLESVVKETLRSRPVVPVVARKLSEQATVAGFSLPKGTILMVSIYLVHHDPETYPDPQTFDPERFVDGVPADAAWIPFGGGTRRCLGASFAQLEMRVVLREVLTAVELSPVGEAGESTVRKRFTFAPGDGAAARVTGRRPTQPSLGRRRFRTPTIHDPEHRLA
jgi:cytochrome P450 family 135